MKNAEGQNQMKYSVIIPCYNEEQNVEELTARLEQAGREYDIQWVLVENGSTDGTGEYLERACAGKERFRIVRVERNQGYGYGLICGMARASGDYIGWLHADLQVSPEAMLRCVRALEASGEKRVLWKGRRMNRSAMDRFFTASMSVLATVLLGRRLYDIGAIPVLFDRALLPALDRPPYDFSIETYVYWKAISSGFTVRRFPVDMRARKRGVSSWDRGLRSKLKQSAVTMKDLLLIRAGKQVR